MALLAAAATAVLALAGTSIEPHAKPWCDPSPSSNYSFPIKGIQCNGLHADRLSKSPAACAAACCADATCVTWLFGTGTKPPGCWKAAIPCKGPAVAGWDGASKTQPPVAPPPPPPAPPPPPPNGVRLLLYGDGACTSGPGIPDMTYKLDTCSELEPFPHLAHDAGVTIAGALSGTKFTLKTWATNRTCGGSASGSTAITIGACVNLTAPGPAKAVEGVKWVKAWSPP